MGHRVPSLGELMSAYGEGWRAFVASAERGESWAAPGVSVGIGGEPSHDLNWIVAYGPEGVAEGIVVAVTALRRRGLPGLLYAASPAAAEAAAAAEELGLVHSGSVPLMCVHAGDVVRAEGGHETRRVDDIESVLAAGDILGDAFELPVDWCQRLLGVGFAGRADASVYLSLHDGRPVAAAGVARIGDCRRHLRGGHQALPPPPRRRRDGGVRGDRPRAPGRRALVRAAVRAGRRAFLRRTRLRGRRPREHVGARRRVSEAGAVAGGPRAGRRRACPGRPPPPAGDGPGAAACPQRARGVLCPGFRARRGGVHPPRLDRPPARSRGSSDRLYVVADRLTGWLSGPGHHYVDVGLPAPSGGWSPLMRRADAPVSGLRAPHGAATGERARRRAARGARRPCRPGARSRAVRAHHRRARCGRRLRRPRSRPVGGRAVVGAQSPRSRSVRNSSTAASSSG